MKHKRIFKTLKDLPFEFWLIFTVTITFSGVIWLGFYLNRIDRGEPRNYCGEVIQRGYDMPTSGYKSHTDPVYWVVIKLDNGYSIRVNVSVPVYYSAKPRLCFMLDKRDLDNYGNGKEHLIP